LTKRLIKTQRSINVILVVFVSALEDIEGIDLYIFV